MVEKSEPKAGKIENPEGINRGASLNGDKRSFNDDGANGKPAFTDDKVQDLDGEQKFRSRSPSGDSRGVARKASPPYREMRSRSRSGSPHYSPRPVRGRHSRSRSGEVARGEGANKRAYSPEDDTPYT